MREDQYNLASGKPPKEPPAKKRKTEEDKEQCVDVKESDADKSEEIEEVKDDRIANPVEVVTSAEDEDATDTKLPNVPVFHLAEIPATSETVEVIDEEDDQSKT